MTRKAHLNKKTAPGGNGNVQLTAVCLASHGRCLSNGIWAFPLLSFQKDRYLIRLGIEKGVVMSGQELLIILLVGLIAGWLAGQIVRALGLV